MDRKKSYPSVFIPGGPLATVSDPSVFIPGGPRSRQFLCFYPRWAPFPSVSVFIPHIVPFPVSFCFYPRWAAGDSFCVGDRGCALSGGQRMRVALARAFYCLEDADILVLDDVFAALDARTAKLIAQRLVEGQREDQLLVFALNKDYVSAGWEEVHGVDRGAKEGKFELLEFEFLDRRLILITRDRADHHVTKKSPSGSHQVLSK